MAEEKKGLFDKAKDAVNNIKDGNGNGGVKDKWDNVKEKGDQVVDRFGGGDDNAEPNTEESNTGREMTDKDTTTRAGDDQNDKGNDGDRQNQ